MKNIPADILTQHIAVLGKTGSGKTSTAKLAIEQVVADGARVCVLDPIKSDWWGLTSSVNGKQAGLPFHILGGPRGHVPLHASAGKAIGEIVASGALPLSIIDMADFEPGGQAKFFTDFAPTLLRKMRGVVYLVIEEAHLFAPKERSGVGAENLSIHWAKTLATAGRSKGIRLVLVTQRTQALHNALLGSCDTLIAHRLTAPADQEPVVKWLKANTTKEVLDQVSTSLASLKTGHGWICSGEAKLFELVHFPRIHTYDNTATPTGDGDAREIKTAPVDQEKLRAIIGDAVDQAKADDPRELRKQVAALKRELASGQQSVAFTQPSVAPKRVEVLTDTDRALLEKVAASLTARVDQARGTIIVADRQLEQTVQKAAAEYLNTVRQVGMDAALHVEATLDRASLQKILGKLTTQNTHATMTQRAKPLQPQGRRESTVRVVPGVTTARPDRGNLPASDVDLGKGERIVLTAVAQYPNGVTREQLTVLTGYKRSSRDTYLQRLTSAGFATGNGNGTLHVTDAGVAALGDFEPLPTGDELRAYWLQRLPEGERKILDVLCRAYPDAVDRDALSEATEYKRSSRDTYLQRLGARKLVVSDRNGVRASEELFS